MIPFVSGRAEVHGCFDWLDSLVSRGMSPGLERIAALCSSLGKPERKFPSVLVAGTNGKGSTAATLDSILRAAGYRTGFYSSPHLIRVTERLRLGGEEVAKDRLAEALSAVRRVATGGASPAASEATYFEALTAAAFLILAEERVDVAILEVGLGGRCDATNLAPAIASILTPVSIDHTFQLGTTAGEIAREKAGILKIDRLSISAPQSPEALAVIRKVAEAVRSPLQVLDPLSLSDISTSMTGTRFVFDSGAGRLELETPLAGRHQATNAGVAVLAAKALGSIGYSNVDTGSLVRGVRQTRWPGRLDRQIVDGRTYLIDGCHNPDGAASTAEFLVEAGIAGGMILVLGVLADKDAAGIAAPLVRAAKSVVATRPHSERARGEIELAGMIRDVSPETKIDCEPELERALERARELAGPGDVILVAGSLVLAGEALRWIERTGHAAEVSG